MCWACALVRASQLIVAQLAGAGELDEASAFVKRNIRYNLALNLGISMLVILVRRPLLGLFTENAQVIDLVSRVMFIDLLIRAGAPSTTASMWPFGRWGMCALPCCSCCSPHGLCPYP